MMNRSPGFQTRDMLVPVLAIAGVFLFLRATNQTPDGLSYAVAVRTGLDMFHPHHMIYVPIARLIHLVFGADPITATLIQNLFWTVVLGLAAWRLAGLVFAARASRVMAAVGLLAARGVMIYSVRVETYLPALACLALATVLAIDRPGRPWLLAPTLALAVLYHQTNVLFFIPLLVLMVSGGRGPDRIRDLRQTAATLTGAGVLVLGVYLAGFRHEQPSGDFWAFTLSYARAPIEAWGSFAYYSPTGVLALAVSQLKMILPVRSGAALVGGPAMLGVLAVLVGWHLDRLGRRAPLARLRVFSLVFLAVYLLFFLWWVPGDMDFFLATLLPLWLLSLIFVADLAPRVRSLPLAGALVLILAVGNIFFTILPMHRDPGPGRALALALDRAAPAAAEMVTGYSVQQEMIYFTARTRVHEGDGLAREVLAGEAPWSASQAQGPVLVVEGPYLRELLDRNETSNDTFLRWLVDYDSQATDCLTPGALPGADGVLLGPDRQSVSSWPELVSKIRALSQP
jgi:hypothetical protein